MAKRPEDRYQLPIEVVAALGNVREMEVPAGKRSPPPQSDPLRPGPIPTPIQETIIPSSVDDTEEGPIIHIGAPDQSANKHAVQFALACVAVAALTILLVMLLRM
jgi:hypothetical protein